MANAKSLDLLHRTGRRPGHPGHTRYLLLGGEGIREKGGVFRIEERLASLVAETRQRSSLGPGKGGWRTNFSSRTPDSTCDEYRELLVRPASSALRLRNSSRQCGSVSFTNEETSPDRVRDLAKPESKLQPFPQPRGCSQTVTPTHTAAEFRFS